MISFQCGDAVWGRGGVERLAEGLTGDGVRRDGAIAQVQGASGLPRQMAMG